MAAVMPLPQSSFSAKRDHQPPTRQPNKTARTREYLTPDEVQRMITAARQAGTRLAERDALLIMMAYRHRLRAAELAGLRWDQIDFKTGMFMSRGASTVRPPLTRSVARSHAHCVHGSVNRPRHRMCSRC
jgi:integrase